MAIYSLSHTPIGRTTHEAGTAGAHLVYITRASACTAVLGAHMPVPTPGRIGRARVWLDAQEQADRKNARVVDKLTLALPLELDAEARLALVRYFAERLTEGEVPWLAAVHDQGKDAHNPHAHLVLRDRHVETGKRVVDTSEKGSTERIRMLWEEVANGALMAAEKGERIDRRSLRAQRAGKLDAARTALGDWSGRDDGRTTVPSVYALDRAEMLLARAAALDRKPKGHEGPQMHALEEDGIPSTKLARIREARRTPSRVTEKIMAMDRQAAAVSALVRQARDARAGPARAAEEARRRAEEAARARETARQAEDARTMRESLEAAHRATRAAEEVRRAALTAEGEAIRRSAAEKARHASQEAAGDRMAIEIARMTKQARNEVERARVSGSWGADPFVAASRARVLRRRALSNNVTGFFRNLRGGAAMFVPPTLAALKSATFDLLDSARWLRNVWNYYCDDREFRKAEANFVEASAGLTELHMILGPVKHLDGADLAAELDRLRELEAFPDQALIQPAMGQATGRAAAIEAYVLTPEGAAKMVRHRADLAARDEQVRREAREREVARDRREERRIAELHRERVEEREPFILRASTDPEVAAILDGWGVDRRTYVKDAVLGPSWDRRADDGCWVADHVGAEIRALDRDRRDARTATPGRAAGSGPARDRSTIPSPSPTTDWKSSGPGR